MGYVVRQTLPTESSPAPRIVTSVINLKTVVSSADPKNGSKSSSQVLSSDPSYNREKRFVHSTKKVGIPFRSCGSPVPLAGLLFVSQSLTESVSFCPVGVT